MNITFLLTFCLILGDMAEWIEASSGMDLYDNENDVRCGLCGEYDCEEDHSEDPRFNEDDWDEEEDKVQNYKLYKFIGNDYSLSHAYRTTVLPDNYKYTKEIALSKNEPIVDFALIDYNYGDVIEDQDSNIFFFGYYSPRWTPVIWST